MKRKTALGMATLIFMVIISSCGTAGVEEFLPSVSPPDEIPTETLSSKAVPLEVLPEDYSKEQAEKDGVYVNIHGMEIFNQQALDKFLANVAAGKSAFVRVMRYTIEGDPILMDFTYDGNCFAVASDTTRDKFGARLIETQEYTRQEWEEVKQILLPLSQAGSNGDSICSTYGQTDTTTALILQSNKKHCIKSAYMIE